MSDPSGIDATGPDPTGPDPTRPDPTGPDPTVPDPTVEAVGLRTHPLSALVQGVLWAGAAFVGLAGSLLGGNDWGLVGILASLAIALVGGLVVGALAGYLGWYFTRYVIDGNELRITSGVLTKSSRRIPYERIQSVDVAEPFVARVVGLAELRIDMAGGDDSRTSLHYLPLDEVRRLRRLLLHRAHGHAADAEPVDEERTLIARVAPERIIIGTLLSLDFLGVAALLVAALVTAVWTREIFIAIGGILPFGAAIAQIVARRVVQQWDFRLSRGERGLRIERGLLSRTSQTIPFDRVQGVAVKEPFIWRRLGWQRLEVDVAGYAAQSDDDGVNSTSTLMPITDPALAASVVAELLPTGTERITLDRPTTRSRLFAPIGWRYRSIEARAGVVESVTGWLERTTSIVPHTKNQSVELRQGPLQRWRGVATVEIHSPPGPVDVDGRHLDQDAARRFWREHVDRI